VTPPGQPVQPIPGATRDPVLIVDSIYVRELDVWGVLNTAGSGGFLVNPMTTLGDLIAGGVAGAALRLGIGGAGQVLTVVGGVPAWANSAAGFANPMTTLGDLITGGAVGAAGRLGVGGAGQVLTVSGGVPTWQNSPAGFTNPMTQLADVIVGGVAGTPLALHPGTTGQVLTLVPGPGVGWQTNPAGFANPMTTSGDMISGTSGGAAVRLPGGTAGQVLTMAGGVPSWQPPGALGSVVAVPASGDTSGATDKANLLAAFAALPNGGTVALFASTYYLPSSGLSLPPYVTLQGSGHNTVINCVGGGTGTYVMQANAANPTGYTRLSGNIFDLVIDGTGAGNGAIGYQIQDMNGVALRVAVRNFTGTGSIGIQIANNNFSTNMITGFLRIENCSTALQFNSLGAETAIEHIYLMLSATLFTGQNGIVLTGSTGVQGSGFWGDLGPKPDSGTMFVFGAGCVFSNTFFNFKSELSNPSTAATTVSFNGAGSGFASTFGMLFFSPNFAGFLSNIGSGGKFTHHGTIQNESTLLGAMTAPGGKGPYGAGNQPAGGTYDLTAVNTATFPVATGTAVTNNTGVPVLVTVAGGTLSGAFGQVNGVTIGDVNTRVFLLPRGQAITLNWSVAPTGWVWQAVG
jgi:hypothetical protein